VTPVSRDSRWGPAAVIAALLLVLLLWLARRDPGERVVTVAATPKIVTVPVLMPVPPPGPPAPLPAPPAPAPPPSPHILQHAPPHGPPPAPALEQVRAAPPPPAAPAPSTDVSARYREVGTMLRQHPDDALWTRYRWIRLGDCLQSDEKRRECVRMLDAIASDSRGK